MTPCTVRILFLGGTIGFAGGVGTGEPRRLTGRDLLESLGAEATGIALEPHDLLRKPSSSLSFADVSRVLAAARAPGVDGVVVVQGTDTMEETAFLLDLLWDDDRPLVLTGAMRKPTALGADGPANLAAAIRVAAHSDLRGQGVLVVMNDQIHAARFVQKTHTTNVATFQSRAAGPLGLLIEGHPLRMFSLPSSRTFHAPASAIGAQVPVVTPALGDDGATLRSVADLSDGVVVAALGGGHVPASWVPTLHDLASRMPVVLSSRTGVGPMLATTYSGPGSETDLLSRGVLDAGILDPLKARLVVQVGLACGYDSPRLAAAFESYRRRT
jgi:L-asparaginase